MVDNKTKNLHLPLPDKQNLLENDVERIIQSFDIIDKKAYETKKSFEENLLTTKIEIQSELDKKANIDNMPSSLPDMAGKNEKVLSNNGIEPEWIDLPVATNEQFGFVKPDGTTIEINSDGLLSSMGFLGSYKVLPPTVSYNDVFIAGAEKVVTLSSKSLDSEGIDSFYVSIDKSEYSEFTAINNSCSKNILFNTDGKHYISSYAKDNLGNTSYPNTIEVVAQSYDFIYGKIYEKDEIPSSKLHLFIPCNGNYVSKYEYPKIFSAIGFSYGKQGDYFKLPLAINKDKLIPDTPICTWDKGNLWYIYEPRDNLYYITTGGSLYKVLNGVITTLIPSTCYGLINAPNGDFYVGAYGQGFWRFDINGNILRKYTTSTDCRSVMYNPVWNKMLLIHDSYASANPGITICNMDGSVYREVYTHIYAFSGYIDSVGQLHYGTCASHGAPLTYWLLSGVDTTPVNKNLHLPAHMFYIDTVLDAMKVFKANTPLIHGMYLNNNTTFTIPCAISSISTLGDMSVRSAIYGDRQSDNGVCFIENPMQVLYLPDYKSSAHYGQVARSQGLGNIFYIRNVNGGDWLTRCTINKFLYKG